MGYEVVQGSNGNVLSFTIREGNTVVDLTNATVELLLTLRSAGKIKQAEITDPTNGKCRVVLSPDDILFDGVYAMQITVTFANGNQFTSSGTQKLTVTKKLGFIPVAGGGTGGSTNIVSGNNGHILVNGVDVKVYDDTTVNDQISTIQKSDVMTRLGVNTSGKLTIDGNEFKNGDSISTSTTNGNILINGQEFKVYDDQSVQSDISNILNMDIIKRLGITSGGKISIDGVEQTGGGTQDMTLVVKDYFSGSSNVTKTYTNSMVGFEITNDGTTDLSFTINGLTIPVKAGEVYSANFDPFTQVTINSTAPYRSTVLASLNGTITTDTTPPNNVTGLATSNVTSSGLTLSWTASTSSDIASYDIYQGSTLLGNTTNTTYGVTGLSAITAYTFTVKAKDSSGNVASGTSVNTTTPSAPDNTAPTVTISPNGGTFGSTQTVTLSGTDNSGGTVNIYYTLDGSTPTASSTKYTSAISISSTTTIKYIGVDPSGNISAVQSALFTIDTVAPNNVTNLVTSNVSATALTLTWTASTSPDIASYDVYNGSTLLGNVSSTTYNVSGLAASTAYTFYVKAKDQVGNVASGTSVNVTTSSTVDTTPPSDVTGLTTGTATINTIPVSWTLSSSNDVANYEVAYSLDSGSTWTVASNLINSSSTSYTINGLTAGTNYTIRVIAIDTSGNRSTGVTTTKSTAASVNYALSATPSSGTYNATQNVVLATSPSGATIYYTTDGSTPTTSSSVYSSPIVISANGTETIKFFAQDSGGNISSVQTATYTIDTIAPTVTISPLAGTYNATQSVTISSNETSTIYYTVDGSTPTTSSSVYSAPISVSATETIKYLVIDTAGNQTTGSATYTIQIAPNPVTNLAVTTASITPSQIPVTWTTPSGGTAVANYEVSYMPSGGSWTIVSSTVASNVTSYTFTGLHQTTNYTLRVVALDASNNRSTDVTVTATTATLTASASPAGGTFSSAQTVTLSSNGVTGTTIYYTTDNSTPTTSSSVYSSPITVSATETIKFYAVNPIGDSSVVQTQTYTISSNLNPIMYFDSADGVAGSNTWTGRLGNTATLSNFNNNASSGWNNGYLLFDSVDDTVSINLTDTTIFDNGASIEIVFNELSETGTGNIILLDAGNVTRIVTYPSGLLSASFGYTNTSAYDTSVSTSANVPFTLNTFNHLVITSEVFNGNARIKLYLNGVLKNTTDGGTWSKWRVPISPMKLFSYIQRTSPTELKLLKVYKGTMSATQVSSNYSNLGV